MKTKKTKQGISLIVLVITIIVMIILAAAIILSLSSSGIIDRANEAVDKTDKAQVQNLASLAWAEAYLNGARTKEELMLEVSQTLKEQGITKADYLLDVTENGVEVESADTWECAYTCTGGVWSDKIEKGNPANGEIVAKFYKTGKKLTVNDEAQGIMLEPYEYKLVITGKGVLGETYNPENGIISAWFEEVMTFNPADENSEVPMLFGISEIIISGAIEKTERMHFQQPFYASLTDLTIEDASCNIERASDPEGNLIEYIPLKNLTMLGGQISIGRVAFAVLEALEKVVILGGEVEIGETAFANCRNLTSVKLGEGVTSIGKMAFYNCTGLKNVTIPNSVTQIGEQAFGDCAGLESAIIGNGITKIGTGIFLRCTNLKKVVIIDGLTSIENSTFSKCTNLNNIIIPNSVTTIGNLTFDSCSSLTTVYYTGTEDEWNQITIGGFNEDLTNANIVFNYTPNN